MKALFVCSLLVLLCLPALYAGLLIGGLFGPNRVKDDLIEGSCETKNNISECSVELPYGQEAREN